MKYKVTLAYTVDVDAEDETEAQEEAEKLLEKELDYLTPLEIMKTYFGDDRIYFPANDYGIKEGYYDLNGLVGLLRNYKTNSGAIQFIADMLEP